MEVFIENCAGLDVHSETFPTLTKDLFRLLKWLESHDITHIAMESTGVYWKPVFNVLEDFFDITLEHSMNIKYFLFTTLVDTYFRN